MDVVYLICSVIGIAALIYMVAIEFPRYSKKLRSLAQQSAFEPCKITGLAAGKRSMTVRAYSEEEVKEWARWFKNNGFPLTEIKRVK